MSNIALLFFGFFILTGLVLLYINNAASHALKFAIIIPIAAMMVFIGSSLESYKGWPTKEGLEEGEVVSVLVVEPSIEADGQIYYWATPTPSTDTSWWENIVYYRFNYKVPRVYTMPYNKDDAGNATRAKKALRDGESVFFSKKKSKEGLNQDQDGDTNVIEGDDYLIKIKPPVESAEKDSEED